MPFLALWSAVLNQYSISYLPSCTEIAWVSISSSPELCLAWAAGKCPAPLYLEHHQQRKSGLEHWPAKCNRESSSAQQPLC